jgi:hypothetical protein
MGVIKGSVQQKRRLSIAAEAGLYYRVVDPDPAGSEIIFMFGSGSGSVI